MDDRPSEDGLGDIKERRKRWMENRQGRHASWEHSPQEETRDKSIDDPSSLRPKESDSFHLTVADNISFAAQSTSFPPLSLPAEDGTLPGAVHVPGNQM